MPAEGTALGPEEWTPRSKGTAVLSTPGHRAEVPAAEAWGTETLQVPPGPIPERARSWGPGHGCPSRRGLPQFAGGTRDPLILPEVSEAGAEAADLFHVGLGHPPLLAVCQADALQPAWGHTGQEQRQWHPRDTKAGSARGRLGPVAILV